MYRARLDEVKREWQDEKLRDAARTGNLEVIRSWPNDGAINATGQGGWTALHFAAREGRSDVVAALLAHKGDPSIRTSKGEQPLHCAAEKGHVAVVALLCTTPGVDVNAPGPYKASPLHVASSGAVAEVLLEHGADKKFMYRGRNPETHHTEKGNTAIARAISKWKLQAKIVRTPMRCETGW